MSAAPTPSCEEVQPDRGHVDVYVRIICVNGPIWLSRPTSLAQSNAGCSITAGVSIQTCARNVAYLHTRSEGVGVIPGCVPPVNAVLCDDKPRNMKGTVKFPDEPVGLKHVMRIVLRSTRPPHRCPELSRGHGQQFSAVCTHVLGAGNEEFAKLNYSVWQNEVYC